MAFFVKDFFMILCILVFIGSDFVCVGDVLLPTYFFSYPNFSVENNYVIIFLISDGKDFFRMTSNISNITYFLEVVLYREISMKRKERKISILDFNIFFQLWVTNQKKPHLKIKKVLYFSFLCVRINQKIRYINVKTCCFSEC